MLSKTSSSSSGGYIHQLQSNDTTTQWIEAVFQIKCIATSEQTDAEWDKAFRLKMCITFIHTCIYLISECISLSNHTILRYEYDLVFFLLKDPEKWLMAHRTKWLNLVSAMSTVLNWFYLLAEFLYIFFLFYFFAFDFGFILVALNDNIRDRLLLISSLLLSIFVVVVVHRIRLWWTSHPVVISFFFLFHLYHRVICLGPAHVKTIRLWSIFYWIFCKWKVFVYVLGVTEFK